MAQQFRTLRLQFDSQKPHRVSQLTILPLDPILCSGTLCMHQAHNYMKEKRKLNRGQKVEGIRYVHEPLTIVGYYHWLHLYSVSSAG